MNFFDVPVVGISFLQSSHLFAAIRLYYLIELNSLKPKIQRIAPLNLQSDSGLVFTSLPVFLFDLLMIFKLCVRVVHVQRCLRSSVWCYGEKCLCKETQVFPIMPQRRPVKVFCRRPFEMFSSPDIQVLMFCFFLRLSFRFIRGFLTNMALGPGRLENSCTSFGQ